MGEIKVEMARIRETTNKVVYNPVETGMAVQELYVVKAAMKRPYPDKLVLVLQAEFS